MAPSSATKSNADKKKLSKIIILHLSPKLLKQFVPRDKSSPSPASSLQIEESEELNVASSAQLNAGDNASESNSTPAPGQDASTPGDGSKKRKAPGAAPRKSLQPAIDTMSKPKGKPGPKKKPRLEDGTIDHATKPPVASTANHKLGPKANTGAINAGLRALDRSGTPCRKWARKGFQLKSFTGVAWEIPTWRGGEDSALTKTKNGDSTTDTKDISLQSSSDAKQNGSDVAMDSVAGDQTELVGPSTPAASSPVPMPAATAVAAAG